MRSWSFDDEGNVVTPGLKIVKGVVLLEADAEDEAFKHRWIRMPRATTKEEAARGLARFSRI